MTDRLNKIFLVMLGSLFICAEPFAQEPLSRWCFLRADYSKVCFELELADEPEERSRGLMHRKSLPKRAGMIFDFEEQQPIGMWMKNTFIALDMIFLDANGRVVFVHHQAEPHSLDIIRSPRAVRYTVELNAGAAKTYYLGVGDRIFAEP